MTRREIVEELVASRRDRQWCLFLDRDGVINRRLVGDYVRSWDQFEFLPGAVDAVAALSNWAPYVVVVTNQQGVGKGLVTEDDLADVHTRMRAHLAAHGAEVDAILVCRHLAGAGCGCRKPRPGLAQAWLAEHPSVDAGLSMMVGDSDSDMAMASALSATTGGCVRVKVIDDPDSEDSGDYDVSYSSLAEFASDIRSFDGGSE